MQSHRCSSFFLVIYIVLACGGVALAQGTPLTLGPMTVNVPPGWVAQTNSVPVRLFSPDSTPQAYFSVEFMPFEQTTQDLRQHHAEVWTRLTSGLRPVTQPQNGTSGQFIWTRVEAQRAPGQNDTLILYSAKASAMYIPVAIDAMRPDLLARNLPALDAMLRNAQFSAGPSSAPAAGAQGSPSSDASGGSNVPAPPPRAAGGAAASLSDYVFATPPGWTANQYSDGIVLMSPESATNERCLMTLWPMRATTGDLIGAANSIFQEVYRGYRLVNETVRRTPMPPSIVRGTSGQGWDYVVVRRGIAPPNSPESRLGFVFVAKLNNRLAVISGLSRDPLVSSCMGELVSNAWPKFFYSLSFKNWNAPAHRRKVDGRHRHRGQPIHLWRQRTLRRCLRPPAIQPPFQFRGVGHHAGLLRQWRLHAARQQHHLEARSGEGGDRVHPRGRGKSRRRADVDAVALPAAHQLGRWQGIRTALSQSMK
jgi:hypothetical protein